MAQRTSLGTSRYKSSALRRGHRSRLAAAAWAMRAKGYSAAEIQTQDYRTSISYAGVEYTCNAYLDRVEARATMIVEDIILSPGNHNGCHT
jgi:hypothetical protein